MAVQRVHLTVGMLEIAKAAPMVGMMARVKVPMKVESMARWKEML